MPRLKVYLAIFLTVTLATAITVVLYTYVSLHADSEGTFEDDITPAVEFEEFHQFNNSVPSSEFIVPNIVHFIRFGCHPLTFIDAVCILAAWKHQTPNIIFIHTDQPHGFNNGPYWNVVKSEIQENVQIMYRLKPLKVFGKPLSEDWLNFHAGDVARLQILMEYGGIFLDNDSYIVKSLDKFRNFEMTLGWQDEGNLSNQVIIANKNARFLKLWLESYRDYEADKWFYNAGEKPTIDILMKHPYLIHREKNYLAEWIGTPQMIYLDKSDAWRQHYAIHLLIRHQYILGRNLTETATYPVIFNEQNILKYEANIKYMALDVYPFNKTNNM